MLKKLKALYKKEPAIITGILAGIVVSVAGALGIAVDVDNLNEILTVVLAGGGAGVLIRGQVTPNESVALTVEEAYGIEPGGEPSGDAHPTLAEKPAPSGDDYENIEVVSDDE